jgi:putative transcriptional regulator
MLGGIGNASTMKCLQGQLLIASPHLLDPNFIKTVVLLIQHSDQGALGVVLNRPTSKKLKELWKEVGSAPCTSEQRVCLGGPVSGPLMAIHTNQSLAEVEILPGVFFAARREHLDGLVLRPADPLKVFFGHAGWGPGQLDNEVKAGGWLVVPATTEYVFYNGEDLWERASKQAARSSLRSMLKLKHFPEDPSMN